MWDGGAYLWSWSGWQHQVSAKHERGGGRWREEVMICVCVCVMACVWSCLSCFAAFSACKRKLNTNDDDDGGGGTTTLWFALNNNSKDQTNIADMSVKTKGHRCSAYTPRVYAFIHISVIPAMARRAVTFSVIRRGFYFAVKKLEFEF